MPLAFWCGNILAYAAEAFVVQGLIVIIDCVENVVTHIVPPPLLWQFIGDFTSKIAALCDYEVRADTVCTNKPAVSLFQKSVFIRLMV